ncbi:MAG: penicillin acylase family protein [Defluviicoccus sp.]
MRIAFTTRFRALAALVLGGALAGCTFLKPLPPETTIEQRLAAIPKAGLPLERPVVIHWNEHQIPFIEAEDDGDAAFALGLVHAHLRLGQMAAYRRIARGRIAEMAGPLAADIDHGLRILDFGRSIAAVEAGLPAETRLWLERFVAGVNHYQAHAPELPYEYSVLGLTREPWTIGDVLTVGRLAGTDVTWLVWFNLLRLHDRPDWPQLWARLVKGGNHPGPGTEPVQGAQVLGQLVTELGRSGSNSLAVAGQRSTSGGALIANDPHLGLNLPNIWLIAGLKSPSYHVVGLMVPGLPVFGIGRNPWIAWGGTNMRAGASDLIDVSGLPASEFSERRETIRVRWWPDRTITVRETRFGPVMTDAPQLADLALPPLALRWTGHAASDEVSAFLKVARARDFDAFRSAFKSFSVPGQNMLYADAKGNIGEVMAVHVPDRSGAAPADVIISPAEAERLWSRQRDVESLPAMFNPTQGFLASANNRPPAAPWIGTFFSSDDRVERMAALIGTRAQVELSDLKAAQRDVCVPSAKALNDLFGARIAEAGLEGELPAPAQALIAAMRQWDGCYDANSRGAVAFELFRHAFATAHYGALLGETDAAAFASIGQSQTLMLEDIATAERSRLAARLGTAATEAAKEFPSFATWGEMHRLRLAHPLSFLPVIGQRFRFGDYGVGGSTDTLMKTAHALTNERHATRYGANARHLSDLSDLDSNAFVILGGQDGWLNSTTFLDQVPAWREGRYIPMPLRLETVRRQFPMRMDLTP